MPADFDITPGLFFFGGMPDFQRITLATRSESGVAAKCAPECPIRLVDSREMIGKARFLSNEKNARLNEIEAAPHPTAVQAYSALLICRMTGSPGRCAGYRGKRAFLCNTEAQQEVWDSTEGGPMQN